MRARGQAPGRCGGDVKLAMVVPHAPSDTRLNEYDQLEWWDVARRLHPAMTWEEFQRDWDEFQRMKNERTN